MVVSGRGARSAVAIELAELAARIGGGSGRGIASDELFERLAREIAVAGVELLDAVEVQLLGALLGVVAARRHVSGGRRFGTGDARVIAGNTDSEGTGRDERATNAARSAMGPRHRNPREQAAEITAMSGAALRLNFAVLFSCAGGCECAAGVPQRSARPRL